MLRQQILKRNAKDEPPVIPGLYCQVYKERLQKAEVCQIMIRNILATRKDVDEEGLLKAASMYATSHTDSFEMTLQNAVLAVQEGLKFPWEVS